MPKGKSPPADGSFPPVARRLPSVSRCHGIDLVDDYAWLRAPNWLDVIADPRRLPSDIRAHLQAENAYAKHVLAPTAGLRRALSRKLDEALADDAPAVPDDDGPWSYYTTFADDADHPRFCRRPRTGGTEQILLDADLLAQGEPYFDIGGAEHSPDHRLFAYAVDRSGAERFTIRIRDLSTGTDLPEEIDGAGGDLAWAADSRTLFYVRLDQANRPLLVYRHVAGTSPTGDVLVYEEMDPAFDVSVATTLSRAFVMVDVDGHHADEIWLIDASAPEAEPRVVVPRAPGHQYEVEHFADRLYITTTSGAAKDYRICEAPLADPRPANWREIVPHEAGCRILDTLVAGGHLVWIERRDGRQRIRIRGLSDGDEHTLSFDEASYVVDLERGYEQDSSTLRFTYQSMITPEQTWEYDLPTRRRTLLQADRIGAGYDPKRYVLERIECPSHDGVLVPVTMLRARDTPLDGSAPLLLEGYGGYGDSLEADFAYERFLLVDRGFIYALAHVRGGQEKGFEWHVHGRHFHKPNSPKDYEAVAEHLVVSGYAARGRIVARGESAGGMLVAAAANMAPDFFLAVSANVPFVDVLNTMLDPDLPLTPGEWPEWGNPLDSAEEFALIRSYCPYQNVRAAPYPRIFARTGLADQRVGYWEAAKWVARLRASTTSANPVLLTIDMTGGGHDGAAGRSGSRDEIATEFAFILSTVAGAV
jgi:oligopeptidase B